MAAEGPSGVAAVTVPATVGRCEQWQQEWLQEQQWQWSGGHQAPHPRGSQQHESTLVQSVRTCPTPRASASWTLVLRHHFCPLPLQCYWEERDPKAEPGPWWSWAWGGVMLAHREQGPEQGAGLGAHNWGHASGKVGIAFASGRG